MDGLSHLNQKAVSREEDCLDRNEYYERGRAHTIRIGPGYCATRESVVSSVTPPAVAGADSPRESVV